MKKYFEFQLRTKIMCGPGQAKEVAAAADELGGSKIMIVTDKVLEEKGVINPVIESVEKSHLELVGVFNEVPENSEVEIVTKGYNHAKEKGVDLLVAVGGGSVIDTAKGMNILLSKGGDLLEDHQGAYLLDSPLNPLIALPTTAGTGSEVTFAAVIKDSQQKAKLGFISQFLAPNTAILDPKLTLTMPPKLTAATGMDALTHAIESLHSTGNEPIADALSVSAIELINNNLREAVKNGDNLEARYNMLLASNMAGLAFSNTLVGIVHATAHACGGLCNVPHGVANSILLPYGMEFNLNEVAERYRLAAKAMDLEIKDLSNRDAALKAIEAVRQLTRDIGLPQKLSEVGVKKEDITELVELSIGDGTMYTNPKFPSEEEVQEFLEKAL